jgi:hypothetical protein
VKLHNFETVIVPVPPEITVRIHPGAQTEFHFDYTVPLGRKLAGLIAFDFQVRWTDEASTVHVLPAYPGIFSYSDEGPSVTVRMEFFVIGDADPTAVAEGQVMLLIGDQA